MIGGVVADDDHHRHPSAARVVQVGQAVAQSGAQVQQHRRGPVGDAGIAVGRAGGHAFEKGQHAAHSRNGVQCGHEVHLRRARVGEAHVDAAVDQGVDQGLGTVHLHCLQSENALGVAAQEVVASLVAQPEIVEPRQRVRVG